MGFHSGHRGIICHFLNKLFSQSIQSACSLCHSTFAQLCLSLASCHSQVVHSWYIALSDLVAGERSPQKFKYQGLTSPDKTYSVRHSWETQTNQETILLLSLNQTVLTCFSNKSQLQTIGPLVRAPFIQMYYKRWSTVRAAFAGDSLWSGHCWRLHTRCNIVLQYCVAILCVCRR